MLILDSVNRSLFVHCFPFKIFNINNKSIKHDKKFFFLIVGYVKVTQFWPRTFFLLLYFLFIYFYILAFHFCCVFHIIWVLK